MPVQNELHRNIQDVFNDYQVQMMNPQYIVEPLRPLVVQRTNGTQLMRSIVKTEKQMKVATESDRPIDRIVRSRTGIGCDSIRRFRNVSRG